MPGSAGCHASSRAEQLWQLSVEQAGTHLVKSLLVLPGRQASTQPAARSPDVGYHVRLDDILCVPGPLVPNADVGTEVECH